MLKNYRHILLCESVFLMLRLFVAQVALAVRALQRYRLGTDMSLFATDQFASDPTAAYPGYPSGSGIESTETYQSPPFTEPADTNPKGYQVPAY